MRTSRPSPPSTARGSPRRSRAHWRRRSLDIDSSESPVHGNQEGSASNGHFESSCYHPLFCFNNYGDCEEAPESGGPLVALQYPAEAHKDRSQDSLPLQDDRLPDGRGGGIREAVQVDTLTYPPPGQGMREGTCLEFVNAADAIRWSKTRDNCSRTRANLAAWGWHGEARRRENDRVGQPRRQGTIRGRMLALEAVNDGYRCRETPRGLYLSRALLDYDDPIKVIGRLKTPLFSPEETWEKIGNIENVVSPTGAVVRNGRVYIYYGAADRLIAARSVYLIELLTDLEKSP
jgi:hypothetical protein